MKQKGEELLVINKKIFFLILFGIALIGIIVGYTIGYVTTPVKEVYINRAEESEKTVLSTTVGTAFANKQEPNAKTEVKQEQTNQSNVENVSKPKLEIAEKQQEIDQKKDDTKKQVESSEQKVKTEIVKKPVKSVKYKIHKRPVYTVQVGAFSDIANANVFQVKLKEAGFISFLAKEDLYKVRVGKYEKFSQAKKISQELHSKGFENFILKISYKGGKP